MKSERTLGLDRSPPLPFGKLISKKLQDGIGKLSEIKIDVAEHVSKFVQSPIQLTVNQSVKDAAKMMSDRKTGAAVVIQDSEPIGIITEWDILSRLVARGKDADRTTVKEIMSSPVTVVSSETTVGDAISLMMEKGHRRLAVKEGKKFLGIITLSQVVGNQKDRSIQLAMLEPSKGVRCPYCGSILKDREEMSNHIDRVHIREEVLQGIHGMNP
ncbi:MAG: CBS domain-containing protein [Thaumarchaeota archaeon]|nr:CBS domain-containing protein [Nitrososphaerota archaeon]